AHPQFARGEATTAFIEANREALLPDRSADEERAAALVAALLRASPDVSVTHGFPAPVRLRRGETVHALRVFAGARGCCRVEGDGPGIERRVTSARAGVFEIVEEERNARIVLERAGHGGVWARIDGRTWDFEDITFEPATRAEAETDGKVRA